MNIKDFVSEFSQEELDATKETDSLIYHAYINDWDKIPEIVKKRVWTRRMLFLKSTQGTMKLTNGFSFDSDSKVKLYA